MNSLAINVRMWLGRMGQLQHETAGFSLPLHELSNDDLTRLSQVTDAFLEWSVWILRHIIHPAQRPQLRSAIAYLNELKERQEAAAEERQKHLEELENETWQFIREQIQRKSHAINSNT